MQQELHPLGAAGLIGLNRKPMPQVIGIVKSIFSCSCHFCDLNSLAQKRF